MAEDLSGHPVEAGCLPSHRPMFELGLTTNNLVRPHDWSALCKWGAVLRPQRGENREALSRERSPTRRVPANSL